MPQFSREQMEAATGRLPNETTEAYIRRQQNLALNAPQKKPEPEPLTREQSLSNLAAAQARRDQAASQKAQAETERKASLVGNPYAQALDTNIQLNPKQRKRFESLAAEQAERNAQQQAEAERLALLAGSDDVIRAKEQAARLIKNNPGDQRFINAAAKLDAVLDSDAFWIEAQGYLTSDLDAIRLKRSALAVEMGVASIESESLEATEDRIAAELASEPASEPQL